MVEQVAEAVRRSAIRDVKADLDERRIARFVSVGLPLVTATVALALGVFLGPGMAILVLAAGMLLGVISLFWASLRVLSGDAALSPELEALDATAHAVDALASRKTMLVRALKDLDNERALGKLEADDHEQLSTTYRAELKDIMKRIDASLEPHRPKAESAVQAYLLQAGLVNGGSRSTPPQPKESDDDEDSDDDDDDIEESDAATTTSEPARVTCPSCAVSNEPDATFCKKCGTSLAAKAATTAKESADDA
jgi:hypothetical protein